MKKREAIQNRVRIIGGTHRGRMVAFADLPGLRPTGDRVRETLFNWLQPLVAGSTCLDLFAGSGALGFEAASRDAKRVVMVEQSPKAAGLIREQASKLALSAVEAVCAEALGWLACGDERFDIVFLDPPFAAGLLESICTALQAHHRLNPNARIYLEQDASNPLPRLPENWETLRDKRAGQVRYLLCRAQ